MQFKSVKINKKPNEKVKRKSGYYVKLEWMYGDADGYSSSEYGPFFKGEEAELIRFVNMLEKALDAFPNGRGGCDCYADEVPEIRRWTECINEDDEYFCDICKCPDSTRCDKECPFIEMRIGFKWETTPDGSYCDATLTEYNVVYYDMVEDKEYECVFE